MIYLGTLLLMNSLFLTQIINIIEMARRQGLINLLFVTAWVFYHQSYNKDFSLSDLILKLPFNHIQIAMPRKKKPILQ